MRDYFAVDFCKQFWRKGKNIFCLVHSRSEAERLDKLLWEIPDSFIPHGIEDENSSLSTNSLEIGIGWSLPKNRHGVLVNLTKKIPDWFAHFDNLVEIVVQEQNILKSSRDNWRFLSDSGYQIKSFDLRT